MNNITNHKRFTILHDNSVAGKGEHSILKDTETGVLYYMVNTSGTRGGVGLTPLLDADGKVIVDN